MIELLIALVIVAVVSAVALPSLQAAMRNDESALRAADARVIWNAIGSYRQANGGAFPPASELGPGLLRDDTGRRLLRTWPTDGRSNGPLQVVVHAGAIPPQTVAQDSAAVYYHVDADRRGGWLAAYTSLGTPMFVRSAARERVAAPEADVVG